jgi:hypothetical protein
LVESRSAYIWGEVIFVSTKYLQYRILNVMVASPSVRVRVRGFAFSTFTLCTCNWICFLHVHTLHVYVELPSECRHVHTLNVYLESNFLLSPRSHSERAHGHGYQARPWYLHPKDLKTMLMSTLEMSKTNSYSKGKRMNTKYACSAFSSIGRTIFRWSGSRLSHSFS